MLILCTLSLHSKRDVLLVRQRARQIARLFGYEAHEQACIAAGAFAVAAQALRQCTSGSLRIQIENKSLLVLPIPFEAGLAPNEKTQSPPCPSDSTLRLVKPLPMAAAEFPIEDLTWLARQLDEQARFTLFEEIQHQNQEMLGLLHELHRLRAQLDAHRDPPQSSAVA
jgi:hypothetical protein